MTRALTRQNEAEDIGSEQTKLQEPKPPKSIDPVIPQPAIVPKSRIAEAVELARKQNAENARRKQEARDTLEASLMESEPPRDELLAQADAMLSVTANTPEARELAKVLSGVIAHRQELARNVRETLGVTIKETEILDTDIEEKLIGLIGTSAVMREAIRGFCEAAGTVRIDELVAVKASGGRYNLVRRFVDVGDDEEGQDPIVDVKYLIPAALRASARFRRLMLEHAEAGKAVSNAQAETQRVIADSKAAVQERDALRIKLATADAIVSKVKPSAPGTDDNYYLKADDSNLWLAKYEGPKACFLTRWHMTTNHSKAHPFAFKEDAQELLQRLQMARVQRIGRQTRETLRVVAVRYEDHSA